MEASKTAIQKEYTQKIADARAAHDAQLAKLRQRLNQLLVSSRETVTLAGSLGKYDPENQRFPVSIPEKTFQITVPLNKGPEVKDNIGKYRFRSEEHTSGGQTGGSRWYFRLHRQGPRDWSKQHDCGFNPSRPERHGHIQ
jgi:hypothetical protein